MSSLGGKAAIAGIGQTEFSKESGRSELQLACEAVKAAIDDAGLQASDIDGMVTFTMDSSDEIDIARNVGIGDLTFFSRVHHGGGAAAGTVVQAAMAVATGTADAVVCYRAFNERSGFRFGGSTARPTAETPMFMANYAPFGLLTPAAWVALHAQRYMSTYGVTNEDFGRISVVDRAHAARNPDAWFYERPITLEDHQNSRWVIEPVLRLLDCPSLCTRKSLRDQRALRARSEASYAPVALEHCFNFFLAREIAPCRVARPAQSALRASFR